MKPRLIALFAFMLVLSFSTVAFSLKGSQPSALIDPTPTPEPSPSASSLVTITGKVSNGSGTPLTSPLSVTLHIFNTQASQELQTMQADVQADGSYQFKDVPADAQTAYVATLEYETVFYSSAAVYHDGTSTAYDMPVTVYDSTSDLNVLTLDQVHINFDFPTEGAVQVVEVYILSNAGQQSVTVPSDGATIPFIQVPAGATDVKYQLANGSAPLMSAENGFAIPPSASGQYGIVAVYSMTYANNRLDFSHAFSLPATAVTVFVPDGVRLRSKQLTKGDSQEYQGQTYQVYDGKSMDTGTVLSLTLSGKPGASTGSSFNNRTILLIGVGTLGLVLIAVGIFLYFRDRKLPDEEDEEQEESETDPLGNDRDAIMDAIITLDDQFKAGQISKEAYEERRAELKERLKELV